MTGHSPESNPLRDHLQTDELLLWGGQPQVRAFALRGVWGGIVIGMAFIGITIPVTREMIRSDAPFWVYMFSALFVLAGLYCILGHLVVAKIEAEHTFYGVTNRRILILYSHFFQKRFAEIQLKGLSEPLLSIVTSRVGTIYFSPPVTYGPFGKMEVAGFPTADNNWTYVPVAFQCIENANDVFRIIKSTMKEL